MSELLMYLPALVWDWIIFAVILLVIEVFTQGLTSIWLAGGAFAAAVTALVTDRFLVQLLIFALVSLFLILVTRPIAIKKVNVKTVPTNVDALIGKTAEAATDIDALEYGEVRVEGKVWTAVPVKGTPVIKKGDRVRIRAVEGVKLVVEKEVS